jgi:predicted MFS family arabinose efflux permease
MYSSGWKGTYQNDTESMEQPIGPPSNRPLRVNQRVILLATCAVGHGLKHLFNAAFFVLLPEIKMDLRLTNVQVGALTTIRNIAGGFANLPAGLVADRFGKHRAEILGGCLVATGAFAYMLGMSPNYWTAVFAAGLITVAISFWHPAAIGSLAQQFANRRGFAIGIHGTGGSVGEAAGPILAGALLSFVTWRFVSQVSLIPAIISGATVWIILRGIPPDTIHTNTFKSYFVSVRRLLSNKKLLLILLITGGFSGGQSTVLTFLPIYLREDLNVSTITLGVYLSLAHIAGIGSQPVMGLLSDRFSRKIILAPALVLLSASIMALGFVPPGFPLAVVVLIMGLFLFPMMAILLAAAMDLVEPDVQATTVSLVFGASVIVSGLAPAIAGRLADHFAIEITFVFSAIIVLASAVLASVTHWSASDNRLPNHL